MNKHDYGFDNIIIGFKTFKSTIPVKLGNIGKNHFLQGFRKGGGQTDSSIGGWRRRKNSSSARKRSRSSGRALLVDTGSMRSALKVRRATFNKTSIGIYSVDYAKYHNEGTGNMPKREIVGDSRVLEQKIKNKITKELDKLFK